MPARYQITRLARYAIAALSAYSLIQSTIVSPIHDLLMQVEILKIDVANLKHMVREMSNGQN